MSGGKGSAPATAPAPAKLDLDASKILSFNQDYNGDTVYSQKKAIFAHIPADLKLLIPDLHEADLEAATPWDVDLKDVGKKDGYKVFKDMTEDQAKAHGDYKLNFTDLQMIRITALNYYALVTATPVLSNRNAFLAAALRARWLQLGALNLTNNHADGLTTEHTYIKATNTKYGAIVNTANTEDILTALGTHATNFKAMVEDEKYGIKWVVKHADNIWCAVEYVFRVRSHHFKDTGADRHAFTKLYTRFMQACYEGEFDFPNDADWFPIAHTAIHPFRISALPKLVAKFVAYKTAAASAYIRLSGAPVGTAVITTTHAALDTMSGEVWYPSFETIYSNRIAELEIARDAIMDNKFGFHIGSSLYGVDSATAVTSNGVTKHIDDIKSSTSVIAAACQGLINALAEAKDNNLISSYALENAKSLEKPAAATPLLAMKVKYIVEGAMMEISDSDSTKKAIAAAFPDIAKKIAGATSSALVPTTGTSVP